MLTQIRMLLEEHFDQVPHCLQCGLYFLSIILFKKTVPILVLQLLIFRVSKKVWKIMVTLFQPCHEKIIFFPNAKTKAQISFAVTAKLISAFVFATGIVQSLYFLNSKFQASSHLLWLYRLVCVGPGQKPRRPVFSQRGSFLTFFFGRVEGLYKI